MGLRAKKSDKRRKTFDKYGKYTSKHLRIRQVEDNNHEEKIKNQTTMKQNQNQSNKNRKMNKKNKKNRK